MTPRPAARTRSSAANRVATSSRGSEAVGSSTTSTRADSQSHSARAIATPVRSAAPRSATGRQYVELVAERIHPALDVPAFDVPADPAASGGHQVAPEHQVLDRAQGPDQAEILMDEAEAGVPRVRGRGQVDVVAAEPDLGAGVGLVVSGKDLDQRRLAAAVLTDQSVDLPAAQIEVDLSQGPGGRKGLRQAAHRQQGAPRLNARGCLHRRHLRPPTPRPVRPGTRAACAPPAGSRQRQR